ncbi:hypothetical protein BVC80_8811g11 [Macleaya cordata]|uniref:Uncharacterized protein n=1 Tax=Macleaya cordata TaxID=56857 RepID=A0A200PS91_MACCD|nr:hypothetical protein BVC80_8811g11 [Macleaya cordata]
MDPGAFLADKLKGFAKSGDKFVMGILHWRDNWNRRNPVEILKRLQREAFSDLMKLRDRQDKVERMISFYKSNKGSPFQEANTRVKGEVDVVGALLLLDNIDQQSCDTLSRAGIRTGTASRFTFETTIRQKDALAAEFVANQNDQGYSGDVIGSPLSLTKVTYLANVSDWFSAVVIPVGAQCKDVAIASNALQHERSLTDFSSFGSLILGECHSAAAGAGLMVKRSNVTAALAEFVSGVGMIQQQPNSVGIRRCFSTFGQVICQLSQGTKLTLMGVHKKISRPCQQIPLQSLTVPVGSLKRHKVVSPDASSADVSTPLVAMTRNNAEEENTGGGSIAVMVESELDESTRIGGWIEMQNSSPRYLKWAVTMSDTPEDELVGWGLSLGGGGNVEAEGHSSSTWDHHFQVEAFLKFNMLGGKRFSLQPGLVYVMDGTTRIPALMFRSSWYI